MTASIQQIINALRDALPNDGARLDVLGLDEKRANATIVRGAACNSADAFSGCMFVCKGENFKRDYLKDAIAQGTNLSLAPFSLAENLSLAPICKEANVPLILTDDIRRAQAIASKVAWGAPDEKLTIVGITGTKGKTTVATFVEEAINGSKNVPDLKLFPVQGRENSCLAPICGFIGTHRVFDGRDTFEPPNTTPEPPDLYRYLNAMVKNGCTHCVMEVSSQGLKYDRVYGLSLDVIAITNVGVDHIAPVEHPSIEDYVASKFKIADFARDLVLPRDIALVDEVQGLCEREMAKIEAKNEKGARDNENGARDKMVNYLHFYDEGLENKEKLPLQMLGAANQKNARCALSICEVLGLDEKGARDAICNTVVEGRMNVFVSADEKIVGIVDYAHTKESYELFFSDVKANFPDSFIVAYFGASGGKALQRCIDLPKTASKFCDYIIITTDDPGPENPAAVVNRCAENVASNVPFEKQVSRDDACARAFEVANKAVYEKKTAPRAVVCALGKGAESVCVCSGRPDIPIVADTVAVREGVGGDF